MALGPGSIAFTGFNGDGADSIGFVALEDIPAGTVIYFTDNGWNGTAFAVNEGRVAWTVTTTVAAGQVVLISNYNSTPLVSTGTIAGSGSRDFSGSGEVVYAYVGSAPTTPTAFLAALATTVLTGANDTLTGTGLALGATAIQLTSSIDIAAYTGIRTGGGSFASYAAIVNTAANWVTQDGSGDQSGDGTAPDTPFS